MFKVDYKSVLFFVLFFFTSNVLISQKNIHDIWDSELKKYVDEEGNVNYRLWKKNSKLLEKYLDDDKYRDEKAQESLDYVKENLTWSTAIKRLSEDIDEVI